MQGSRHRHRTASWHAHGTQLACRQHPGCSCCAGIASRRASSCRWQARLRVERGGHAHAPQQEHAQLSAEARANVEPGCAVTAALRRRRQHTLKYPELARARQSLVVVVGLEVAGRFGTETVQLLHLLARHRAESGLSLPPPDRPLQPPGLRPNPGSRPSQPSARWRPLCWNCRPPRASATDPCPT